MPMEMASTPMAKSGCETVFSMLPLTYCQPEAGRGEHEPDLHRPEDASDRRADRARRAVERDRRRLEEAFSRRRLDVREQIFVRREAVHQFVVHLGLHFRHAAPAAMLDQRAHEPRQHAGDEREDGEDRQAFHRRAPDAFAAVLAAQLVADVDVVEIERGAVRDLRMLRQKRRQRRIVGEIRLVRHQRRIELEHAADFRRIALQRGMKRLARFMAVACR